MSKAFTKESDSDATGDAIPRRSLAAAGGSVLTPAGAKRFQAELEQLLARKKSSDSADSHSSAVHSRIRQLQELLQSSTVAELPAKRDTVGFGANVQVRYPNGELLCYQIVGPEEVDPAHDRISAQSPLGRALVGRRAGETFRFRAPAGEQQLEIRSVHYD